MPFKMLQTMKDSVAGAKDVTTSFAAKHLLQEKVGNCAEIQDLQINTSKKIISLKALLRGETQVIEVELEYSKTDSGLKVEALRSNRQWMEIAAEDHLLRREFQVPQTVLRLL